MKLINVAVILTLLFSVVSLALHLTPGQPSPVVMNYQVEVTCDVHFRVYVLVNGFTVVADEFQGSKNYPVIVTVGDQIEIHAYAVQPMTVKLWNPQVPVTQQTGDSIEIGFVVPES